MTKRDVRIPPLPVREWRDEEKQALAAVIKAMPSDFQGGANENTDYTGLELLFNHPALAQAFFAFSQWILRDNELPTGDKELAILRVGVLVKSEYEWTQHILIARHEGVSDEEIRRVLKGPGDPDWKEKERFLLTAVDELVGSAFIGDDTWRVLEKHYNVHQLMEIMFTVGTYHMMGMAYNSMGVPLNANLQAIVKEFPLDIQEA